jgi:hypothetical protein
MAKTSVKLDAPREISISIIQPIVDILNKDMDKEQARLTFASSILLGLTKKYSDLGGRQDEEIIKETLRLTDLMMDAYFNT